MLSTYWPVIVGIFIGVAWQLLKIMPDKVLAKQGIRGLEVKYLSGFDSYKLNGSYTIWAKLEGLELDKTFGKVKILMPWNELTQVEAGSEADLRNRVTASRLLLTGVFAFGLKKERKKGFYISILTDSSLGLFELNTSMRDNRENEKRAKIFTSTCNERIISASSGKKRNSAEVPSDSYAEIEKLGELLEKKLITKSEFEKKKKQILGL